MRDASMFARAIADQLPGAYRAPGPIDRALAARAEPIVRQAQLGAIRECLRRLQQAMNAAPRRDRAGLGIAVDRISDFAIEVAQTKSGVR